MHDTVKLNLSVYCPFSRPFPLLLWTRFQCQVRESWAHNSPISSAMAAVAMCSTNLGGCELGGALPEALIQETSKLLAQCPVPVENNEVRGCVTVVTRMPLCLPYGGPRLDASGRTASALRATQTSVPSEGHSRLAPAADHTGESCLNDRRRRQGSGRQRCFG